MQLQTQQLASAIASTQRTAIVVWLLFVSSVCLLCIL